MLFILDRKQTTIGVADNGSPFALPYFGDLHTENLEGVDTYTFIVPADHKDSNKIMVNGHIVFQDLDNKFRLFTIKEVTDTYHDYNKQAKEVFCESTAISELLSDIVRPFKQTQTDIETLVEMILNNANAGWSVGNIEYDTTSTFEIKDHMTVLEALRYLTYEVFFKEMYFTVEVKGNEIVKKKINIVEERGRETNVRFDYSHALRGASRTENTDELATALIGLGKADSAGNRITLVGVDDFDDGDIYKESTASDWIGSESSYQRFNTGGGHIFGVHIDDNATTKSALLSSTKKALERRKIPMTIYSSSILDLERVTGYPGRKLRLGDRVIIKDETFSPPIAISGRVMELIRSYTDPMEDSVDLGRYKKLSISTSAEIQKLQKTISANEEKWNANVYKVEVTSSNGNIFKQNGISTTLDARVWANDREITLDIPVTAFKWTRKSSEPSKDAIWNMNHSGGTRSITVTPDDVKGRAVFNCDVSLD